MILNAQELRYDAIANMSTLKVVHISRASARQRAGRAGRVRPGHCWRLYSAEWLASDRIQDYTQAEILRVPLEEVVLQVLLLKLGLPDEFLVQCLEPPSISQIRTSVASLLDIKAILPKPNLPLTALGYHLAQMPVDIRIGKMLITASLLNCIEPALTVAAALAGKSPFTSPPDKSRKMDASRAHLSFTSSFNYAITAAKYSMSLPEAIQKQADTRFKEDLTPPNDVFFSDHLATVNAYNLWEQILLKKGNEAAYTFCRENYLSHPTFNDIMKLRENFRLYLRSTGFLPQEGSHVDNKDNDGDFDPDESGPLIAPNAAEFLSLTDTVGSNYGLMRCALCAGLFPQVVRASKFDNVQKKRVKGSKSSNLGTPKIMQGDGVEVFVHPGSLTHSSVKYLLEGGQGSGQGQRFGRGKDAFIVYHKKVASDRVYLHDCTLVPAAAILLFGGDLHISRVRKGSFETVTIGSWIHFKMSELHAVLFRRLQTEMESMLRIKVEDPTTDITKRQAVLVRVIEMLLE
jgi:Helicase associated domain (HA2)/Oligonucleotide/oligosaccharide-binding (OB)-fold